MGRFSGGEKKTLRWVLFTTSRRMWSREWKVVVNHRSCARIHSEYWRTDGPCMQKGKVIGIQCWALFWIQCFNCRSILLLDLAHSNMMAGSGQYKCSSFQMHHNFSIFLLLASLFNVSWISPETDLYTSGNPISIWNTSYKWNNSVISNTFSKGRTMFGIPKLIHPFEKSNCLSWPRMAI